jgi:hypothetical protein
MYRTSNKEWNAYFVIYFSYIMAVSFILGGNDRPAALHWQTWSHNVVSSTPHHQRDSNSQLKTNNNLQNATQKTKDWKARTHKISFVRHLTNHNQKYYYNDKIKRNVCLFMCFDSVVFVSSKQHRYYIHCHTWGSFTSAVIDMYGFPHFRSERTWWRLFPKRVVRAILYIYLFIILFVRLILSL